MKSLRKWPEKKTKNVAKEPMEIVYGQLSKSYVHFAIPTFPFLHAISSVALQIVTSYTKFFFN